MYSEPCPHACQASANHSCIWKKHAHIGIDLLISLHSYLYPSVNIEAGLQKIGSDLKSGKYSNEYDIQNDIYSLVASAYDGHFNYIPDITRVRVAIMSEFASASNGN